MNKTRTDIEFEEMLAWAKSIGGFDNLVAELRTRDDQEGRAEAVKLLKALQRTRPTYPAFVRNVVLLAVVGVIAFFIFSAILGG